MKSWPTFCLLPLCFVLLIGCNRESEQADGLGKEASVSSSAADMSATGKDRATATRDQPFDRDREIGKAEDLLQDGKQAEAAAALQRVLLVNPTDVEVLFRLARVRAEMGDLAAAVEFLDSIPENHPEAGLPAIGQAADWCMALERYDEAEARYQKVLARVPDAAVAHRQLAFLYNRQGRRHEAAEHIRTLCRLGDVRQDELHALMVVGHAIFDDPNESGEGGRRYLPIGPAATARMLYTASHFDEAVETLDEMVQSPDVVPSLMAFYGLLAVEAQDQERFQWWLSRVDDSVKSFSEYWAAIGAYLVSELRFEEAIRALAEALDRDPTDIASMRRINQALEALGRTEEAERWIDRYVTQRDATLASNKIGESESPDPASFETVADGLEKLERPLEAMTWRLFGAFYRQAGQDEIQKLNEQRTALMRSDEAFPDQSERLCGLAIDQYSLPELDIPDRAIASLPSRSRQPSIRYERPRFENIAGTAGMDHTYYVASQPQPFRFALYQSLGGGAAALDYDLDGWVDLYLAQGGSDPPALTGKMSNLLYRQVDGRLEDITERTGTPDHRYSIGITSGDWNQDGFADLVIANIGNKVLLINNGDGTFQRQEFDADPNHEVLISSVAMGDVSGDTLPDIVSLYYVEDKTMLDRPEVNDKGEILTVSPASFEPGIDRITINDGTGAAVSEPISDSKEAASTGLGVVIANWDEKPGNEIFVGNDVRPNHLWARSPGEDNWVDIAALSGCAHGYGGLSTASMGIAVADFDGSGTLDIHIANFYQEPVSLFMNRGGSFEDRAIQFKLHEPSLSVLGFGCQAIDYNNDGKPDLAVTNGNIEKAPGEPLEQPPQFFVNLGTAFRLVDAEEPSNYWQGKYLGRGMAKLDFNRDGQSDLLITHIGSPSALLINRTDADGHWLNLRLVGTQSERDAVGARVTIRAGDQIWSHWLVGGDGYLCHNEAAIQAGLGDVTEVDEIQVTWPSGKTESFGRAKADQHLMLIENESAQGAYSLESNRER
jgi:tetratricopeptide (TPR) repeat protein